MVRGGHENPLILEKTFWRQVRGWRLLTRQLFLVG